MSHDARECGVEIFDKYLMVSLAEDANVFLDTVKLSFAAASAILISSKLHEGKSLLTMANFPGFCSKDLVAFEVMLLSTIGCQMNMLLAPSCFVRHLLGLFPEIEELHSAIIERAHKYISFFQEQPVYLLFAPSTVAISALLICFSIYQVNSEVWLKTRIPDICLPAKNNPRHADGSTLDDVVKCLAYFEKTVPKVDYVQKSYAMQARKQGGQEGSKDGSNCQRSPTSVTSPILGSPNPASDGSGGSSNSNSIVNSDNSLAKKGRNNSAPGSCLDLAAIESDAQHFM